MLQIFHGVPCSDTKKSTGVTSGETLRHKCPLCEGSYCDKKGLKRHLDTIHFHLKVRSCPLCGVNVTRQDKLRRHWNRVHKLPGCPTLTTGPDGETIVAFPDEMTGLKAVAVAKPECQSSALQLPDVTEIEPGQISRYHPSNKEPPKSNSVGGSVSQEKRVVSSHTAEHRASGPVTPQKGVTNTGGSTTAPPRVTSSTVNTQPNFTTSVIPSRCISSLASPNETNQKRAEGGASPEASLGRVPSGIMSPLRHRSVTTDVTNMISANSSLTAPGLPHMSAQLEPQSSLSSFQLSSPSYSFGYGLPWASQGNPLFPQPMSGGNHPNPGIGRGTQYNYEGYQGVLPPRNDQ